MRKTINSPSLSIRMKSDGARVNNLLRKANYAAKENSEAWIDQCHVRYTDKKSCNSDLTTGHGCIWCIDTEKSSPSDAIILESSLSEMKNTNLSSARHGDVGSFGNSAAACYEI